MSYALGRYEVREGSAGDERGPVVAIGYAHAPGDEPAVGDLLDPRQVRGRHFRVVSINRETTPPILVVRSED